jgi:hypothetical protein
LSENAAEADPVPATLDRIEASMATGASRVLNFSAVSAASITKPAKIAAVATSHLIRIRPPR